MDSAINMDEWTYTVCSYISFCEDSVANDKPWVTSSLRHGLFKKHNAFKNGGESEKMEAVREVRAEIKKAKIQYKNKLEE